MLLCKNGTCRKIWNARNWQLTVTSGRSLFNIDSFSLHLTYWRRGSKHGRTQISSNCFTVPRTSVETPHSFNHQLKSVGSSNPPWVGCWWVIKSVTLVCVFLRPNATSFKNWSQFILMIEMFRRRLFGFIYLVFPWKQLWQNFKAQIVSPVKTLTNNITWKISENAMQSKSGIYSDKHHARNIFWQSCGMNGRSIATARTNTIQQSAAQQEAKQSTRALRRLHQGNKNSGICKQNPHVLQPCACNANAIDIARR